MAADVRTLDGKPLSRSKRNERIAAFLADLAECNNDGAIEAIVVVYIRPTGVWQVSWSYDPRSETQRATDLMMVGALGMAQMQMSQAVIERDVQPDGEPDDGA